MPSTWCWPGCAASEDRALRLDGDAEQPGDPLARGSARTPMNVPVVPDAGDQRVDGVAERCGDLGAGRLVVGSRD